MDKGLILLMVLFGMLFPVMIFRVTTLLREHGFKHLDKRTKYSVMVFVVLGFYGLARALVFGIIGANLVHGTYSSLIIGIPSGMYQILQTSLLVKWNHHVSEVIYVIYNDQFHAGRILIRCSIGLVVLSVLLLIPVVIDMSVIRYVNDRIWLLIFRLYMGATYTFNGISFAFLGLYMRFMWTPNTDETRAMSAKFLSIALIFGSGCVLRGVNAVLFLVDKFDSKTKFMTWHTSEMGTLYVPFLVEWLTTTVSLVILTVPSDNIITRVCRRMYEGCLSCWRRHCSSKHTLYDMEERVYDPSDTYLRHGESSNVSLYTNNTVGDMSKCTIVNGVECEDTIQVDTCSVNSTESSSTPYPSNLPCPTFSNYSYAIQPPSMSRKNLQQYRY